MSTRLTPSPRPILQAALPGGSAAVALLILLPLT
jgi:hypothetical protein